MENTLSVILCLAFLLIGVVGGAVLVPGEAEIEYVDRVEYVNNTVEKVVEIHAPDQLDLALSEFSIAYEAEEDAAGNDVNVLGSYHSDEVSVKKIYNDYVVSFNEDGYEVNFEVKMRFENKDDVDFDNYNVTVIFEDNEDTEVIANLLA